MSTIEEKSIAKQMDAKTSSDTNIQTAIRNPFFKVNV
jgi:hypothetical protein